MCIHKCVPACAGAGRGQAPGSPSSRAHSPHRAGKQHAHLNHLAQAVSSTLKSDPAFPLNITANFLLITHYNLTGPPSFTVCRQPNITQQVTLYPLQAGFPEPSGSDAHFWHTSLSPGHPPECQFPEDPTLFPVFPVPTSTWCAAL